MRASTQGKRRGRAVSALTYTAADLCAARLRIARTVRRPPAYFQHLLSNELGVLSETTAYPALGRL